MLRSVPIAAPPIAKRVSPAFSISRIRLSRFCAVRTAFNGSDASQARVRAAPSVAVLAPAVIGAGEGYTFANCSKIVVPKPVDHRHKMPDREQRVFRSLLTGLASPKAAKQRFSASDAIPAWSSKPTEATEWRGPFRAITCFTGIKPACRSLAWRLLQA